MSSRRAAPSHWFRHPDSSTKKIHADALCRTIGAVGAVVVRLDDEKYHVVVPVHRIDPVRKWLHRQTPETEWCLEELHEQDDEDDEAYLV